MPAAHHHPHWDRVGVRRNHLRLLNGGEITVLLASLITGGVALLAARHGAASTRSITQAQIDREERRRLSDLRLSAIVDFNRLAMGLRNEVMNVIPNLQDGPDPIRQPKSEPIAALEKELSDAVSRVMLVCSSALLTHLKEEYLPPSGGFDTRCWRLRSG